MDVMPLTPVPLQVTDPVFQAIAAWTFDDEFVSRMLAGDVPHRMTFGNAQMWAYLDPQRTIVGFGTLDICDECAQFTGGKLHAYIPLLAVNAAMQGRGYGKAIVNHLVEEAACRVAALGDLHPALFLDVYERSAAAMHLYEKCGFVRLNGPIVDPVNGDTFVVMAKRVSR